MATSAKKPSSRQSVSGLKRPVTMLGATVKGLDVERPGRAARIWSRALYVLEDEDAALAWLHRANRSLGSAAPISLLDTEAGYELVLDILARIEYGIVS